MKQAYLGSAMTLADMHFFLLRPVENFHLFVNYPVLGIALIVVIAGFIAMLALGLRLERHLLFLARPHWWMVTSRNRDRGNCFRCWSVVGRKSGVPRARQ
jgi:hypothetical protein